MSSTEHAPLRTEQEVAKKIKKSMSWLQHVRQTGEGPPYLKIGSSVRYRDEDVDAWLAGLTRTKVWEFDSNDTFEPIGDAADRVVDKLRGRS
jgi:predicted DNA-binding transcriptional regulator AlpA